MPYKSVKSKRSYKKQRPKVTKKAVRKIVNKALIRQVEKKTNCVQVDQYQVPSGNFTAAPQDLLANMRQGSTESAAGTDTYNQQMIGLQVRLQYLHIKGTLNLNSTYTGTAYIRMIVVMDHQASNPQSLTLYGTATAYDNLVLQVPHITSPINPWKRFTVLYDKVRILSNHSKGICAFNIKHNMRNMLLKYYPTIDNFYELNKKLLLFVVSYDNTGGSSYVNAQYLSRVTFTDA